MGEEEKGERKRGENSLKEMENACILSSKRADLFMSGFKLIEIDAKLCLVLVSVFEMYVDS